MNIKYQNKVRLAKYIKEAFYDYYLGSKEFYFTSNRLKENNPVYQVNNWSGIGNFDITFDLLSSLNNKLMTNYDITYEINYTCDENVICNIDKSSGVIYSESHSDTITINVIPTRVFTENETLTIHVEATSTSPYVKTIKADFLYVSGKKGATYSIDDEVLRPYLILSVTNANTYCTVKTSFDSYNVGDFIDVDVFKDLSIENKKKCIGKVVNLSFNPREVLLDTTSTLINESQVTYENIDNVNYVSRMSFNIDAMSSKEVRFYKVNANIDYTYPNEQDNSIIGVDIIDP